MYTKVIDIDLRQTDDISTIPTLSKALRKDESQFTLLRLNLLPTYPINLVLSNAKVIWNYDGITVTNGEISNGYLMTHLPIEIAKQLNSAITDKPSKNLVMMTVIGYADTSEANFGTYIIDIYSYKGFDEIAENPDLTTYPKVNTTPTIYAPGGGTGGGSGGDTGGSDAPVDHEYLCYTDNKLNVMVGDSMAYYPYFAISADLDNVSEIDWVCNPNHVSELLDGLYIESQNACMFEWATYVLTSTNKPSKDSDYYYKYGQISSGYSSNLNLYNKQSYGNTTPDEDEYFKNYYYRKIISINNVKNQNTIIYCTTTSYGKDEFYKPIDFSKKYTLRLNYNDNSVSITNIPSTTTVYTSFDASTDIANLFATMALNSSASLMVISDYMLIANKTLYKEDLETDVEATKINELINYVRQVRNEGWY